MGLIGGGAVEDGPGADLRQTDVARAPAATPPEAIGRTPAFRPRLPAARDLLPYLERIDVTRAYSNHGPLVAEFEQRVAQSIGPGTVVVTAASGTAALVGAILATAGRARAERRFALCPSFTFVATAAALQQCGYEPHFVDIDPDDWQIAPERLAAHPLLRQTGVVVPVAPFGRAVRLSRWDAFMGSTGVPVVVDAAASVEALMDGAADTVGHIPVVLSFHATKALACGEGGAIVTTRLATAMASFRALNFGFLGSRESQAPSINGKMSEYHAAVGLAHLDRWPDYRAQLSGVARRYRDALARRGRAQSFHGFPDIASNYGLYQCSGEAQCAALASQLDQHGFETRRWYGLGLHEQPALRGQPRDPLPVTQALARRLLGLPMAPDLGPEQIEKIAQLVADVAASPCADIFCAY